MVCRFLRRVWDQPEINLRLGSEGSRFVFVCCVCEFVCDRLWWFVAFEKTLRSIQTGSGSNQKPDPLLETMIPIKLGIANLIHIDQRRLWEVISKMKCFHFDKPPFSISRIFKRSGRENFENWGKKSVFLQKNDQKGLKTCDFVLFRVLKSSVLLGGVSRSKWFKMS
jgi:hypothetical protein